MNPTQPDLLPDDDAPETVFVRFDESDGFHAALKAGGRRCLSIAVDRKRHGYECVVVKASSRKPDEQRA